MRRGIFAFALAFASCLVGACGELVGAKSDDDGVRANDGGGGPHDEGGTDATDAGGGGAQPVPHCVADLGFATPTMYPAIPTQRVDHVWLSADQLTIWLSNDVDGDGGDDLLLGLRTSLDTGFTVATSPLSSAVDDDRPSLSPDMTTLVFARDADKHVGIFVTQRKNASDAFPSATEVAFALGNIDRQDPWLARSGRLYFDIDDPPHLYFAEPTGPGTWGTPTPVPGVPNMNGEENPVLSDDELLLYFGARESGSSNDDLWIAQRASRDASFQTPQRLTISTTGQDEYPTWTTPDGCTLFFSQNPDIFVTKRGP